MLYDMNETPTLLTQEHLSPYAYNGIEYCSSQRYRLSVSASDVGTMRVSPYHGILRYVYHMLSLKVILAYEIWEFVINM